MYADDTDIIFDVSDLSVLEREIIAIEENYLWLIAKNSSLDTAKTELMLTGCSYIGQINWEKPRRRNFWKDILWTHWGWKKTIIVLKSLRNLAPAYLHKKVLQIQC